ARIFCKKIHSFSWGGWCKILILIRFLPSPTPPTEARRQAAKLRFPPLPKQEGGVINVPRLIQTFLGNGFPPTKILRHWRGGGVTNNYYQKSEILV
ncbi:MAG: hypothetical protein QM537_04460, partial [Candidatus Symbiobacter sp.]|nr:hypothetical protein [Candidatus Symbiobacter sp.]